MAKVPIAPTSGANSGYRPPVAATSALAMTLIIPLWLIIALMATRLMMVVAEAFIFTVVAPRIDSSLPAFTP